MQRLAALEQSRLPESLLKDLPPAPSQTGTKRKLQQREADSSGKGELDQDLPPGRTIIFKRSYMLPVTLTLK